MSFFIPQNWDWTARDRTKQTTLAGLGASTALTTASGLMPYYRSRKRFRGMGRKGRPSKRRRFAMRRGSGRRAVKSGRGLTSEHDRQNIYYRKRMPYYKKKPWIKFVKKVKAAADKDLGLNTVVFSSIKNFTSAIAQNQGLVNFCLYGHQSNSTNEPWHNDLNYLGNLHNIGNSTAADGPTVGEDSKYMFKSGVLDLTVRNVSFKSDAPTVVAPDVTLEVDLYEWIIGKELDINSVNITTGRVVWTDSNTAVEYTIKDNNGTPSTTKINMDRRGATPFDQSVPLSMFRIKILKKTKFFIKPNQTITYQMRDPKNRTLSKKLLNSGGKGFNKPGWTRNILMVYKSIPGFEVGNDEQKVQESVDVGVTRKYCYNIRGLKEDRSLYVTN